MSGGSFNYLYTQEPYSVDVNKAFIRVIERVKAAEEAEDASV